VIGVVKKDDKGIIGCRVLDLFSGAGGLSLGFKEAGFKISAAIDNDPNLIITHQKNFPESISITEDLVNFSPEAFSKNYGFADHDIDGIIGGPPCQGFSLAGPRNFYDKRNKLYLNFIEYVKFFKPKFFLIENVPGLASLFNGRIKDRIIEEFTNMGYSVASKVLLASDYGVPQDRRRIFFIGLTKGLFGFPEATHVLMENRQKMIVDKKSKVTVRDAISDLPLLENKMGTEEMSYPTGPKSEYQRMIRIGSDKIYNHVATQHQEQTKRIISLVPQGKNYKSLPKSLQKIRNFHVAWTRLSYDRPSPTIDTGHRHHFHPEANRVPTVRESARLQSFPDRFIFYGSRTSQYKQVGNAVPPILAQVIAEEIKDRL
jgi:DNA (cytosine-5)-methyltransferase 1